MNRRIILSPDARADFSSAARWYRRHNPDLFLRFVTEVQMTLRRIARFPNAFPRDDFVFKRATANRFPFYIYFTFNLQNVFIRSIIHQRRADSVWLKRREGYWQGEND